MKIVVIGDIHGRTSWKEIVNREEADLYVFMADYFDTFEKISAAEQIYNFYNISEFIKNSPNAVSLIGNHDHHYLYGLKGRASGYQTNSAPAISQAVTEAYRDGFFKMAFENSGILFSHAGITKTCIEIYKNHYPQLKWKSISEIVASLNLLLATTPSAFYFYGVDPHGDDVCQTPIWVRPKSLTRDGLAGCTQVVGHTPQATIKHTINNEKNTISEYYFVDTLGNASPQYLTIEDGQFNIKTLTN
jgi:hypothetical protein